jgi:stage IV sporulation protein FB
MRNPFAWSFAWSFPLGRLFGITIRVHLLFPLVALGIVLRFAMRENAVPGQWIDITIVMALLFFSVLLHEFGHCFAARFMQGDANEILLWPLGGLANCEVPHTPRANFVVAAGGPVVNLVLFLFSALVLFLLEPSLQPHLNPIYCLGRDSNQQVALHLWNGPSATSYFSPYSPQVLLSHFFWVNWVLFLLNLVPAFPLDGGRMLQSVLWNYVGYRPATMWTVIVGFVFTFIIGVVSIVLNESMLVGLAVFIGYSCWYQWLILETGGEDSVFGYDFSQGYTSLERDQPPAPAAPKQSWWSRWRQKRAARKLQREIERREAEESRMDQLLEKISTQGITALTDEERRFMKQFSDRYKNRHQ